MKAFRRLFGQKNDPMIEQADSLVRVSYSNAVSAFGPMLEKFPILQEVYTGRQNQAEYVDHFDFMMTIAGVFIAVEGFKYIDTDEAKAQTALERIEARLTEWNPKDGVAGFEHCTLFFMKEFDDLTKSGHDSQHIASDSIGSWIVSDILQRSPKNEEERRLVRTVGVMVTRKFAGWWQ